MPTATALQPPVLSFSRRATSSRSPVVIAGAAAGWKNPVGFMEIGTATAKTLSVATTAQGMPALRPQNSSTRRDASATLA
jgi:hypothetical protein